MINIKSNKLKSYNLSDKFWLSNKYLKTKQNQKLEIMFFDLFQILYSIRK